MNGFLVIGFNDNLKSNIQIDFFEKYLKSQNVLFFSNKIKSNQYQNLVGFQLYKKKKDIYDALESSVFLNGKIFGKINDINTKKLSLKESQRFVSEGINRDSGFFGFDGTCSIVSISEESIVFQGDIEGYKKVFYYTNDDVFCASNNLTYILKILNRKWKIRKNAVYSYILQRESKWPLTFIEGIKVLPPLTKAIYSDNNVEFESSVLSDYYEPQYVNKPQTIEDVYSSYKRIIKREDSENIAVTLSGGYDSNCLTKLYSQAYDGDFTAVSLGYVSERERDRNVYDETVYAEKIAKHLKIPFKKYIVDKDYFISKVDDFIKSLDQPGHDPSSNFLLNDFLNKDGFDSVVCGMGGDAFFASKLKLNLTKNLYSLSKNTSSYALLNLISKQLNFKSILKSFDTKPFINKPNSFMELREIEKFNKLIFDTYVNVSVKKELFDEVSMRIDYYNSIEENANTNLESYYSYALLSNPDEYHVDLMAQRNNLNMIMPFVNITPVLQLLNASEFMDISSREFEMEIFKGINKELLLKSKSGFSFPYSEWGLDFFEETLDYFKAINCFDEARFNISKFVENYRKDKGMQKSLFANQLIWKLTVVKKYAEYHSLEF